jgi:predicted DNA-binding protein (UPF0251 family)
MQGVWSVGATLGVNKRFRRYQLLSRDIWNQPVMAVEGRLWLSVIGVWDMKFHEKIAEYLPSLRRYSHAVTGNAKTGDAQIAALIETLTIGRASALGDLPLTLGFYRILTLSAVSITDTAPAPQPGKFRQSIQMLALRQRQALLLTSVEGLTLSDVGRVMDCTEGEVRALITAATQSMTQAKTDAEILIVGEHQSAADALRRMLDSFGYAISDVAHSLQDALAIEVERRPGLVVADLGGGSTRFNVWPHSPSPWKRR